MCRQWQTRNTEHLNTCFLCLLLLFRVKKRWEPNLSKHTSEVLSIKSNFSQIWLQSKKCHLWASWQNLHGEAKIPFISAVFGAHDLIPRRGKRHFISMSRNYHLPTPRLRKICLILSYSDRWSMKQNLRRTKIQGKASIQVKVTKTLVKYVICET